MKFNRKQCGLTIIEFTIVSSVTFLLIFAILEIGYFTYSMQSLNDLTRKAARIAAVCRVSDGEVIKTLTMSSGVPKNFKSYNLSISYLDKNGNSVDDLVTNHEQIYYVQTKIQNYSYGFSGLLSFLGNSGVITTPVFETILPAESLGVGRSNYTACK